jgi:hypothetical protein
VSGDHDNDPTLDRLRGLLSGVVSAEDAAELRAVIDLLKQIDGVPVGMHPDLLAILEAFRALPPGTQDKLMPALSETLDRRRRPRGGTDPRDKK